jgi:hypothetical protein
VTRKVEENAQLPLMKQRVENLEETGLNDVGLEDVMLETLGV